MIVLDRERQRQTLADCIRADGADFCASVLQMQL
jgi:hypothetical protein